MHGTLEMRTKSSSEILKGGEHSEDLVLYERIILECVFEE